MRLFLIKLKNPTKEISWNFVFKVDGSYQDFGPSTHWSDIISEFDDLNLSELSIFQINQHHKLKPYPNIGNADRNVLLEWGRTAVYYNDESHRYILLVDIDHPKSGWFKSGYRNYILENLAI